MELISVHVPKTAGVSFRNLLTRIYGSKGIVFDYGDRVLDPASPWHTDPQGWASRERDPFVARASADAAVRVIHGHFAADKYEGFFSEARRIVWLREPVARVVSHYHYWRGLPHAGHSLHRRLLEEDLSLEEFAALPLMRDAMSRLFLRGTRLEDFAFIGLQEYFDEDLRRLAKTLHWPSNAVPEKAEIENRGDASASAQKQLSPALRESLEKLNEGDVDLYRRALERRAQAK